VNLADSFLCGYLTITGLTEVRARTGGQVPLWTVCGVLTLYRRQPRGACRGARRAQDYAMLTTYFEAEIIGPKHGFLTRKWVRRTSDASDRPALGTAGLMGHRILAALPPPTAARDGTHRPAALGTPSPITRPVPPPACC